MVRLVVLTVTLLMLLMIVAGFILSRIKKEEFIGKPSIHPVLFIIAKITAFVCVGFLVIYGFNVSVGMLFIPSGELQYFALGIFLAALIIIILSSSVLKKDLKFGLPEKEMNALQTKGIYGISRHPFYMGFLLIMLSSVLLIPNIINMVCFVIAWVLHHFIMINEEKFLIAKFGQAYIDYMKRTRRYF